MLLCPLLCGHGKQPHDTQPSYCTVPLNTANHTVNHTPHFKSSNNFSFWTLNCFEQFCTAYNPFSRAKQRKYSKM